MLTNRIVRLSLLASMIAPLAIGAADDPTWIETGHFAWTVEAPLAGPTIVDGDEKFSIKDPTIVRHDGEWHLFCTVRGHERSHGVVYLHFEDWEAAADAEQVMLPMHPGYYCAPQVFYFTPHQRWYMICWTYPRLVGAVDGYAACSKFSGDWYPSAECRRTRL